MADTGIKISALPAAASLDGSEAVPVVQGGTTRKATPSQITAFVKTGISATDVGAIPAAEKGAANGVASLDGAGIVPAAQLPSYVDDVVEGYYYEGAFYADSAHTQELTGETGKIYVDLPSSDSYRWGGSAYVKIANPITVDDALSDNSTNPLQNRIITAATLELQRIALGAYPTETASGSVASFDDGADDIPVKSLTVTMSVQQQGSGRPGADNRRHIVEFDSVDILSAASQSSAEIVTSTVSWPSSVGTVYGFILDVHTGLLRVTRDAVAFTSPAKFQAVVGDHSVQAYLEADMSRYYTLEMLSDLFGTGQPGTVSNMGVVGNRLYINIPIGQVSAYTDAGVQEWIATYKPQFCGCLVETARYTLEDMPVIRSLQGSTEIWVVGGTVAATIRADPTLYIDKRLQALGG